MPTPILIFSDSPAAPTGLARITRDLALRIHHELKDEFDVATLGYGHPGSCRLPFQQYYWQKNDYWLPVELPDIWTDFCGDDAGILLTIGDIQRFLQLADSNLCTHQPFAQWMRHMRGIGKLRLWGYFPVDAHGIGGKLPPQLGHTLTCYDRRLVPSKWALDIVKKTLPHLECEAIPHGIDTNIFQYREGARDGFLNMIDLAKKWPQTPVNIPNDALLLGIVATNQERKSWPTGLEIVAELKKTRSVFLWAHTDILKREWSLLEMLSELNLLSNAVVTTGTLSDEIMSYCYSALDVFLGIGRGEGFCFPLAEAMACGTPVMTSSYGAQVDYVPPIMQAEWEPPLHLEGPLNLYRPSYDSKRWAECVIEWEGQRYGYSILPKEVEWTSVWPRFAEWLIKGKEGLSK